MTYCLGWRYRNTVYLVGDTVFTNVPRFYRMSTFGEQHSDVSGEHVAELALKITEIAPGFAVAFAGDDVELAIDIVGFIRDNHSNFDTPEALFNALRINMELKEYVEILLARAPLNGPATLTKWNTKTGIEQTKSDYYEIGKLPGQLSYITLELFKKVAVEQKTDPAALLPMMTAIIQSHGVHNYLIEHNVGGIIFGLRVGAGQTAWQADTAYLLYDLEFKNLTFNFAMARGDILTVYSSMYGDAKFLPFPSRTRTQEQFYRNIPQQIDVGRWHHCTCLRLSDRRVTSIYRPLLDIPSRYVKLSTPPEHGGRAVQIELTPQFQADLSRPIESAIPSDPRTVYFGIRLLIDQPNAPDLP